MPKQITTLSIFLASPSDVPSERNIVKEVINDLNQNYLKSLNLNFELLSWEDSTFPNFGDYPQDVINKQIGDDYDIFIGILWSRFGTPTNRAESGTLEEFQRANSRRLNKEQVNICFYFKTDPIDPYQIDLEQFKKIKDFKENLPKLGGYYWEFNGHSFEKTLRDHLIKISQTWSGKSEQHLKSVKDTKTNISQIIDDEDEGIYDIFENMDELLQKATSALNNFSDLTDTHSSKVKKYTFELDNTPDDFKLRKKIINDFSENLQKYCTKTEEKFNEIKINLDLTINKFEKFYSIYPEIHTKENAIGFREMIQGFDHITESIPTMSSGISSFLNAVKQMPRMTTELNRSKKLMINTLEPFLNYLYTIEQNFIILKRKGLHLIDCLPDKNEFN